MIHAGLLQRLRRHRARGRVLAGSRPAQRVPIGRAGMAEAHPRLVPATLAAPPDLAAPAAAPQLDVPADWAAPTDWLAPEPAQDQASAATEGRPWSHDPAPRGRARVMPPPAGRPVAQDERRAMQPRGASAGPARTTPALAEPAATPAPAPYRPPTVAEMRGALLSLRQQAREGGSTPASSPPPEQPDEPRALPERVPMGRRLMHVPGFNSGASAAPPQPLLDQERRAQQLAPESEHSTIMAASGERSQPAASAGEVAAPEATAPPNEIDAAQPVSSASMAEPPAPPQSGASAGAAILEPGAAPATLGRTSQASAHQPEADSPIGVASAPIEPALSATDLAQSDPPSVPAAPRQPPAVAATNSPVGPSQMKQTAALADRVAEVAALQVPSGGWPTEQDSPPVEPWAPAAPTPEAASLTTPPALELPHDPVPRLSAAPGGQPAQVRGITTPGVAALPKPADVPPGAAEPHSVVEAPRRAERRQGQAANAALAPIGASADVATPTLSIALGQPEASPAPPVVIPKPSLPQPSEPKVTSAAAATPLSPDALAGAPDRPPAELAGSASAADDLDAFDPQDAALLDLPAMPAPLRETTRSLLHQAVGIDPAEVRFEQGAAADAVTGALSADAVTDGDQVLLSSGRGEDTPAGLGVLAHELVHIARRREPRFVPAALRQTPAERLLGDEEAIAREVERRVVSSGQQAAVQSAESPINPELASSPDRARFGTLPAPWEPWPVAAAAGPPAPIAAPAPYRPATPVARHEPPRASGPATTPAAYRPAAPPVASPPAPAQAQPGSPPAVAADTPSIQRAELGRTGTAPSAATPQAGPAAPTAGRAAEMDVEALARQVYSILKRRLAAEMRRSDNR